MILTFRLLLPANRFPQMVHSCVFTPACDRMWPVRWPELANPRLHIVQMCGFSPVCVRWWMITVSWRANVFLHMLHEYGRSPVSENCNFIDDLIRVFRVSLELTCSLMYGQGITAGKAFAAFGAYVRTLARVCSAMVKTYVSIQAIVNAYWKLTSDE